MMLQVEVVVGPTHRRYLSVYASAKDFDGNRLIPKLQNSILSLELAVTQTGFTPASYQP